MSAATTGSPRPVTPASILAGALERLARRARTLEGLDAGFRRDLLEASALAGGLDPYLSRWSTPESADLRRLGERTGQEDWSRYGDSASPGRLEQEMLSGHVEGQVLKMLVHGTKARLVLEIGMFTGYSALAMAEALPPGGQVVACEIDSRVADLAQESFDQSAHGGKIVIRRGPAQTTLRQLSDAGAVFDLVFIDADKSGYIDYLQTVLDDGLLAPGGLICVDNTLMQGGPWMPGATSANAQAIDEFNRTVAADPRVEQVIIPLRDGLTLIRRSDPGTDPR
jgi:caffeoyl-CoA O-methyltransferase